MTEAEWRTSDDPLAMYRLLRESTTLMRTRWQGWMPVRRFRFSARRETLFRCAVCEHLLEIVASEPARRLLELARRAQFPQPPATLTADWVAALEAFHRAARAEHPVREESAWAALRVLTGDDARHGDWLFDAAAARADFEAPHGDLWQRSRVFNAERTRQTVLLREFAGNPFHQPRLPDGWQEWDGGLVEHLAVGIDAAEDFAALPVLADALEDAGCTDADLLEHCRQQGPHQRGCWALDLLLGRD